MNATRRYSDLAVNEGGVAIENPTLHGLPLHVPALPRHPCLLQPLSISIATVQRIIASDQEVDTDRVHRAGVRKMLR